MNEYQIDLHFYPLLLILDLQDTTVTLDFRVTALEENGNQTLTELEVRVKTLEDTAADHETRISAAESDINGIVFSNCTGLHPNFTRMVV